jgi:hypothetical protein
VHKKKGKRAGVIAHHVKERQASSKAKRRGRCRSVAMVAGGAALQCGRGAAPKGTGDVNLWHSKLNESR